MHENKVIRDLTEGNVFRKLLVFSLPYMAANFLHTLYTLVDLAIVGRFTDSAGVAAIANAGNITMLLYAVGIGFGAGGGIFIAQLVGAKRYNDLQETIGTLTTFCLLCAVGLMILGAALAEPLLRLLNVPEEAFGYAVAYLCICCVGMPFTFCYGTFSDTLRGMGDSIHPLYILIFSTIVNTVLDYVFVAIFRWGSAGAAWATVIAQACSFAFSWVFLYRRREQFHFDFKLRSFAIKRDKLAVAVKLSIPLITMSAAINISMMFVNSLVNSYGLIASAVSGIGSKIMSISFIVTSAVENAVSATVGQNMGARRPERAQKTVYAGWAICLVYFAFLAVLCYVFPEQAFRLFSNDPEVIAMSRTYMRIYVWMFLAAGLMGPPLGHINGVGNTLLNMGIAMLDGVIARIGLSLLFGRTLGMGLEGFWLGNALAGFVSVVLASLYFFFGRWRERQLLKPEEIEA